MGDILIKHLEEIIPGNNDFALIDPAASLGSYKKSKVANLPGGSGSSGALQLAAPAISLSVISPSQINLSWSNVSNETGYVLERSLNGSVWTALATLGANVTSFNATGLSSATLYYFRVRATGDGISYSNSEWDQDSATTTSGSIPQLATPTLTASVISSTQINLSWTNVADEMGYQVQQSLNGTSWTTIDTPAANTTTLNVTGLTPATLYYFRVKAFGDGIAYLDSAYGTDSDTTSSGGGLATPANFNATGGTLSIALDWDPVVGAVEYAVEVSDNGTSGWTEIYRGSATDHNHTGLGAGVTKYYRCYAVNGGTSSGYATDNATTAGGSFSGDVTWSFIDSDLEQYNASQGIRKKTSASPAWTDYAISNETLVVGKRLICIADSVGLFSHAAISNSQAAASSYADFLGMRQNDGSTIELFQSSAIGSSTSVVADRYFALFYEAAGTIRFQSSSDGVTWTTHGTSSEPSAGAPYYVHMFFYDPLASYKEVYIA